MCATTSSRGPPPPPGPLLIPGAEIPAGPKASSLRQALEETRLYALADAGPASRRDPLALAEELLAAGVRVVQLRHKEASDDLLLAQARDLVALCHARGALAVIDDRPDVALLAAADGVHLGQQDLPLQDARRVVAGADLSLGVSSHNLEQALAAQAGGADLVALGPIFPTRSKSNPDPPLGLERLARVAARIQVPLVAIGGITIESAPACLAAGATAVAVISDLLERGPVYERARRWLEALP